MWEESDNVITTTYAVDCVAKGSRGESVKILQETLVKIGEGPNIAGTFGADSKFGNDTQKDVKAFQKSYGIKVDGVARQSTWAKLAAVHNSALPDYLSHEAVHYSVSSRACPAGYNPVTKTVTPPGSPASEPAKDEIKKNGNGLPTWVVPVSVLVGVGLLVMVVAGTTRKRRRSA